MSSTSDFLSPRLKASEYIDLSNVQVENNSIRVSLDVSKGIQKYFFKSSFAIDYSADRINETDLSILSIPVLSIVTPIAWATGADVIVDKIDYAFLESLKRIKEALQKWSPALASNSSIRINNNGITKNRFEGRRTALLFSGGLDSFASYIKNRNEKPVLITLIKKDRDFPFYEKIRQTFQTFAKDEGLELHFIRSDVWDARSTIINNELLESDFSIHGWWEQVSHGLVTLGMCAPLSFIEKIGMLKLASTYDQGSGISHGSHYLTQTKLAWADVNIAYDLHEYTRQDKIRKILRGNNSYYKYLRVCIDPSHYRVAGSESYPKNCSHCEKCLRTIVGLILEGIDPNDCNFSVKNSILDDTRHLFETRSINLHGNTTVMWKDIKDHAFTLPNDKETEITKRYSSDQFFEWLRNFDLEHYTPDSYNVARNEFRQSLRNLGIGSTLKLMQRYAIRKGRSRMHKRKNIQGEP